MDPTRIAVAITTANLGFFEKDLVPELQELVIDYQALNYRFTDANFPPRFNSMTHRLQARIAKMFGWQLLPGFDIYLWYDSSMKISNPKTVQWFLTKLGDADMAVFKHPNRNSVQEEADYIKERLHINCPYITPRYKNEWIDEHLKEVNPNAPLYASTAFIYRNSPKVQKALKEWWYFTSRYHSIDQLGFSEAIKDLNVNVIKESYLKIPYLTYTRK